MFKLLKNAVLSISYMVLIYSFNLGSSLAQQTPQELAPHNESLILPHKRHEIQNFSKYELFIKAAINKKKSNNFAAINDFGPPTPNNNMLTSPYTIPVNQIPLAETTTLTTQQINNIIGATQTEFNKEREKNSNFMHALMNSNLPYYDKLVRIEMHNLLSLYHYKENLNYAMSSFKFSCACNDPKRASEQKIQECTGIPSPDFYKKYIFQRFGASLDLCPSIHNTNEDFIIKTTKKTFIKQLMQNTTFNYDKIATDFLSKNQDPKQSRREIVQQVISFNQETEELIRTRRLNQTSLNSRLASNPYYNFPSNLPGVEPYDPRPELLTHNNPYHPLTDEEAYIQSLDLDPVYANEALEAYKAWHLVHYGNEYKGDSLPDPKASRPIHDDPTDLDLSYFDDLAVALNRGLYNCKSPETYSRPYNYSPINLSPGSISPAQSVQLIDQVNRDALNSNRQQTVNNNPYLNPPDNSQIDKQFYKSAFVECLSLYLKQRASLYNTGFELEFLPFLHYTKGPEYSSTNYLNAYKVMKEHAEKRVNKANKLYKNYIDNDMLNYLTYMPDTTMGNSFKGTLHPYANPAFNSLAAIQKTFSPSQIPHVFPFYKYRKVILNTGFHKSNFDSLIWQSQQFTEFSQPNFNEGPNFLSGYTLSQIIIKKFKEGFQNLELIPLQDKYKNNIDPLRQRTPYEQITNPTGTKFPGEVNHEFNSIRKELYSKATWSDVSIEIASVVGISFGSLLICVIPTAIFGPIGAQVCMPIFGVLGSYGILEYFMNEERSVTSGALSADQRVFTIVEYGQVREKRDLVREEKLFFAFDFFANLSTYFYVLRSLRRLP